MSFFEFYKRFVLIRGTSFVYHRRDWTIPSHSTKLVDSVRTRASEQKSSEDRATRPQALPAETVTWWFHDRIRMPFEKFNYSIFLADHGIYKYIAKLEKN